MPKVETGIGPSRRMLECESPMPVYDGEIVCDDPTEVEYAGGRPRGIPSNQKRWDIPGDVGAGFTIYGLHDSVTIEMEDGSDEACTEVFFRRGKAWCVPAGVGSLSSISPDDIEAFTDE